jgi:lipoate-protein ligase A
MGRLIRVLDVVSRPALVLGSTQPASVVRPGVEADVDVVRRASGGGAVLLEPGRVVWVDVFVPADDVLWSPDVGRAFWWLGDGWAAALGSLGVSGAVVHRGRLVTNRWSPYVCFAGLGPGEVTVGGRKVVGMAQRRTRAGSLFQCAVPLAWSAASMVALLDLPAAAADELADVVFPLVGVPADEVVAALVNAFGKRYSAIAL